MRKCSPSLSIKEMQIKTTLRFYVTPVRIATVKNTKNNKCWPGCGEKETFIHCWYMQISTTTSKNSTEALQKLKTELHVIQQYHS
jgi:hypothetical protein